MMSSYPIGSGPALERLRHRRVAGIDAGSLPRPRFATRGGPGVEAVVTGCPAGQPHQKHGLPPRAQRSAPDHRRSALSIARSKSRFDLETEITVPACASAPAREPDRPHPTLARSDHDRRRGHDHRNPARPGAKPVVKLARVARRSGRRGETKDPKENPSQAILHGLPRSVQSPNLPGYETSTTMAVMLSLPPRELARSISFFTEKLPPSARMEGISSVRR